MEAIGRGVRILTWPIRVNLLKVGYKVTDDLSEMVKKDDIMKGIEMLMGDEEMGNRMLGLREIFSHGFPVSSDAALDAFKDFVSQSPEDTDLKRYEAIFCFWVQDFSILIQNST